MKNFQAKEQGFFRNIQQSIINVFSEILNNCI